MKIDFYLNTVEWRLADSSNRCSSLINARLASGLFCELHSLGGFDQRIGLFATLKRFTDKIQCDPRPTAIWQWAYHYGGF